MKLPKGFSGMKCYGPGLLENASVHYPRTDLETNGNPMRCKILLSQLFVLLFMGAAQAADDLPAGDPVLGQRQFAQCTACHNISADGANKVGPSLHGVFGRQAGSKTDFAYSDALKNAGFDWDSERLDQYIRKPAAFLPGNKMAFIGIAKEEVRANIIAYLKEASK